MTPAMPKLLGGFCGTVAGAFAWFGSFGVPPNKKKTSPTHNPSNTIMLANINSLRAVGAEVERFCMLNTSA
jgi:hypothetical protein